MRTDRKLTFLLLGCSVCSVVVPPVRASALPTDSPDLESLFSASISALGGAAELKALQSIHSVADCAGPRGRYTTETFSHRDGKAGIRQTFSDKTREPVSAFVNGDTAWEISRSGQAAPAAPMLRSIVRGHQYQMMPIMFQSMFGDFALGGIEEFKGRRNASVKAKNDLGFRTELFFDAERKLLSGTRMHVPGGSETITTEFSEWTSVGGIKFPSVVTSTDKRGEYVCRFHSITLNKVAPAFFDVPRISGRGTQTASDGTESPVEFEAAWIELYRRDPSGWKRVGNVSNFKP